MVMPVDVYCLNMRENGSTSNLPNPPSRKREQRVKHKFQASVATDPDDPTESPHSKFHVLYVANFVHARDTLCTRWSPSRLTSTTAQDSHNVLNTTGSSVLCFALRRTWRQTDSIVVVVAPT